MTHRSKFFFKEHPKGTSRHCHFDLVVFPSDEFAAKYFESNTPALYAGIVVAVFAFTAIVFYVYSYFVGRRQEQVTAQAARAEAIVSSLFPEHIGNRLIEEAKQAESDSKRNRRNSGFVATASNKANLHDFLTVGETSKTAKPIADLFPKTTIMFADIVG